MSVLVAIGIIACAVPALILVRVLRRDHAERDVAAFDAGQQALRRASKRSPRSQL